MPGDLIQNNIAIELREITKSFGSVVANDKINLTVKKGEILALLGENGSGKTTLMNMLSGIYHPDSGSIYINGTEVFINSPEDAFKYKIGMIHQHFKLVDVFSATENILIGLKNKQHLSFNKIGNEISDISKKFGLDIDPQKVVYNMSVSEKQTVEIVKVLYRGAEILILDEPTAVLTPQETYRLFNILRNMKNSGCAIVIITHKLNEVLSISDRVTVLRKGRSVATVNTAETNVNELTELMVGRPVTLEINRLKTETCSNLLEVHNLTVKNSDGVNAIDNIDFYINGGEILGVAGIAGSGQKELCEAIAGLQNIENGTILYKNENIIGKTPQEIIKLGISMSFVPEDRLGMGLVSSMDIVHNMLLKSYKSGRSPLVNTKPAKALANKLVKSLDIVTPGINTPVRYLSGGNVQKVLIGREIESHPNLLITAYPVRGLDINSSYMIYDLINMQKENGAAIIFIGEDLDVLLELCDRIIVLCHGKITGTVNAEKSTKEELGLLMAGITDKEVQQP